MQVIAWILFVALAIFVVYEAVQLVRGLRSKAQEKKKKKDDSAKDGTDIRKEE